jgi:iron complex outermembrane receptor protein/hemoglobin/transferrin/lactoferrin receptor protein
VSLSWCVEAHDRGRRPAAIARPERPRGNAAAEGRAPSVVAAGLAVALFALAPAARADDPPAPPAAETTEVTVRGQGSDRGATAGRATSRVDRREIEEQLPRSAPDALRYEPGVTVQQTAHGQGSAFIRGRTGQQTLLLFDGIRLSNSTYRQGPNQYFFTIDAKTIHSIEVVRGGGSTRWGSDAIGGVLNARPLEPALDLEATGPVVRPRAMVRATTADGELGFRTQLDVQASKNLRVLAGVGSRQVGLLESGGVVRSPVTGATASVPAFADDGRTQLGTGFREMTADGRAVLGLGHGRRLVAAAYAYRQFDAPRTDQCPPPEAPLSECLVYDEQFRTLAYGAYEGDAGPAAERARVVLSYQRQHERRTGRRPQSFVENPARDDVDTFGAMAHLETRPYELARSASLGFAYGADAYFDRIDSAAWTRFTDIDVTLEASRGQYLAGSTYLQGGAFADAELRLGEHLVVRGGARGGGASAHAPADAGSGTRGVDQGWPVVVGHAGVEVRPTPLLALLANVDRSYRTPNLDDLTSRQQSGPGFQFENAGLVLIVRQRLEALPCATAWPSVQILGGVLDRAATERDPAQAAALRAELAKPSADAVDVKKAVGALEAVFPCP